MISHDGVYLLIFQEIFIYQVHISSSVKITQFPYDFLAISLLFPRFHYDLHDFPTLSLISYDFHGVLYDFLKISDDYGVHLF